MDNWTLTLVRNLAGHQALQAAIDDDWIEIRPLGDEPRAMFLFDMLPANKKKGRPVPALMPTISERETLGWLNPKTFSTKGPGAPVPIQDEIP